MSALEQVAGKPVYDGGSIVNLMSSIVTASGGRSDYALLEDLDAARLEDARHIVLIVVDGLGFEFLNGGEAGRVMRGRLARGITSVYPPTTAAAITTFLTGLAPQQHGLTGWFVYFRELGSVVCVLPFETRLGGMPLSAAGVSAERLFGHTPVFDMINRRGHCVSPQRIARSDFNLAHSGGARVHAYASLPEFVTTIEATVRAAAEPSYVYAYWPELDHLAHVNGIASRAVQHHLAELDAAYEELLARLEGTDTLVLLTADHGFVDVAPENVVDLAQHAPLAEALEAPLCGEPRTAYCYVAPARARGFVDYVAAKLGERALCVESAELVERGYFGPGPPHPRLLDRIGDYTLLMRDGYAIHDSLPGERRFVPLGMHGGGSTAELLVPLVVAEA